MFPALLLNRSMLFTIPLLYIYILNKYLICNEIMRRLFIYFISAFSNLGLDC